MYEANICKTLWQKVEQGFKDFNTCLEALWNSNDTQLAGSGKAQKLSAPMIEEGGRLISTCLTALECIDDGCDSGQVNKQSLHEVTCLFREVSARFSGFSRTLRNTGYSNASKDCQEILNDTGNALLNLCLIQGGARPQIEALLTISHLSQDLVGLFGQLAEGLKAWEAKEYLYKADVGQLSTKCYGCITSSEAIKAAAEAALNSCDLETSRNKSEEICKGLTELFDCYSQATCFLERHECVPDRDKVHHKQVSNQVAQIGFLLAVTTNASLSISPTEEDCLTQLRKCWQDIYQQALLVQSKIVAWAKGQLCPPPSNCQEATDKLVACTKEALAALQGNCLDYKALKQQRDSLNCVSTELIKLKGQTDLLEGFDTTVFNPFGQPLACISGNISGGEKEENPCLLTQDELVKLIPSLAGALNKVKYTPACSCQPVAGASEASITVPELVSGESLASITDGFSQLGELVPKLTALSDGSIQARIAEVENRIQQTQRQLKPDETLGTTVSIQTLQRAGRYWAEIHAAITAAIDVLQDQIIEADKKQSLVQIEDKLKQLTRQMTVSPTASLR